MLMCIKQETGKICELMQKCRKETTKPTFCILWSLWWVGTRQGLTVGPEQDFFVCFFHFNGRQWQDGDHKTTNNENNIHISTIHTIIHFNRVNTAQNRNVSWYKYKHDANEIQIQQSISFTWMKDFCRSKFSLSKCSTINIRIKQSYKNHQDLAWTGGRQSQKTPCMISFRSDTSTMKETFMQTIQRFFYMNAG